MFIFLPISMPNILLGRFMVDGLPRQASNTGVVKRPRRTGMLAAAPEGRTVEEER